MCVTSSWSVFHSSAFFPTVEGLLSPDQVGFRKGRNTCDQVAALTTFIENESQQNLKTGVFLDLTAAYDTVWHTGLLYKVSKSMPYWLTRLVGLLFRGRRFRVHMGTDTSSWRPQRNGLPQGSVLAPVRNNGGPNSGATASSLAENEPSSGGHPLTTSGRHLNVCGDPSTS